nr:MAG TPA: hypothetical protein [Bacteriophage sp.]
MCKTFKRFSCFCKFTSLKEIDSFGERIVIIFSRSIFLDNPLNPFWLVSPKARIDIPYLLANSLRICSSSPL